MNVLKSLLVWLLRVVCVLSISALVYLTVLSLTLLDRNDVKEWLHASGAYNSSLIETLFTAQPAETTAPPADQAFVTNEAVKNAMVHTFTPDFIQSGFGAVIDASYDWLEGKRTTFTFSVPLQAKRETFIAALIKEVEPHVAALPACSSVQQGLCRPDSLPASSFTQQIVTDSLGSSDFLTTPLTEATFSSAASQSSTDLSRLPQLRSGLTMLLYALPAIFGLCVLGGALLSGRGNRLQFFIKITRAVFSNMILSVGVAGLVLAVSYTQGLPLQQLLDPSNPLTPLLGRFLTHMILDIAWTLLFVAGSTLLLSAVIWIILVQIRNHPRHQALPMPTSEATQAAIH